MKNTNLLHKLAWLRNVSLITVFPAFFMLCPYSVQAATKLPDSTEALLNWNNGSAKSLIEVPAYRLEEKMQKAIAACMKKHGLKYTPFIPEDMFPELFDHADSRLTSKETDLWRKKNKSNESKVNPNQVILENLPDSGKEAFIALLWDEKEGCADLAYDEIYNQVRNDIGEKRLAEYEAALNQISADVASNPMINDALEIWSNCATGNTGIYLRNPTDIKKLVRQEINSIFYESEGLPLVEALEKPFESDSAIDDGIYDAALDAGDKLERQFASQTQSCDASLTKAIETVEDSITKTVLNNYRDVIDLIMNDK